MQPDSQVSESLAADIVDEIESLAAEAERTVKPLELDPYRSRLFELFVTAEGAGLVDEESDPDLTADGIGRELAKRWGLAEAAQTSVEQQSRLSPEQLSRMRMLWSFMRMWMEWAYAWKRWPEFHQGQSNKA